MDLRGLEMPLTIAKVCRMLSAFFAGWSRTHVSRRAFLRRTPGDNALRGSARFVDGLLLLSYPLHPPRKPEQLRIQHLPKLHTPALFVHGTRDPFGTAEEVESGLKLIPAKVRLLRVEAVGHDLGFKGAGRRDEFDDTSSERVSCAIRLTVWKKFGIRVNP